MTAVLIQQPFANAGDITVVPQTDPSGFVNFNQGYTPFYEINLASGNPQAKAVERQAQNYLFNIMTSNIQAWQQFGIPPWFGTMPGGYATNAMVIRLNGSSVWTPYRSLVDSNLTDPLTSPASWEYIPFGHESLANVPMPTGGTGGPSAQLVTATTDFNTFTRGTYEFQTDAIASGSPNPPTAAGKPALAGMLEVMTWLNGATTYSIQRYLDRNNQLFTRAATNGSWGVWFTPLMNNGGTMTGPVVLFGGDTIVTAPSAGDNSSKIPTTAWVNAAIQSDAPSIGIDTGTANTYTATFTPTISSPIPGAPLWLKVKTTNTGASTFNGTALVGSAGAALQGNEMIANGWALISYNATLAKYILAFCLGASLQVPLALASLQAPQLIQTQQIQSIAATVASNALTVTFNGVRLDFRSATLSNGAPNIRNIAAPISVVVPSGATLGTISSQLSRLAVIAMDNAGTIELAIVNLAGGTNIDETTLISTTAISAGATSQNVIYSTTARTNLPFRVVGYVEATEATAGTWATAPSTVQGSGGNALTALSSLGYGQIWQAVTRTSGTTYYNTTGRPIAALVVAQSATAGDFLITVNGVQAARTGQGTVNLSCGLFTIIPPGASYILSGPGTVVTTVWNELR